MVKTRIQLIISFIFDSQQKLYLSSSLKWNDEDVSLSLGTFIQFIYKNESLLLKEDVDFCYLLTKVVKKINISGSFYFAIPNDHDMALVFARVLDAKVPTFWDQDNCLRMVEKLGPAPLTIQVTQKNNVLHCHLKDCSLWKEYPFAWLVFRTQQRTLIFCNGSLLDHISDDFENFMNRFLDNDTILIKGNEILNFVNKIYQPHKQHLFWQIQVDLSSLMPQLTPPVPYLSLVYKEPVLRSELSFQYGSTILSVSDKNSFVIDKRTGKSHQRIMDMEADAQNDLMQLFMNHELPFLLQNPGDIARFMDKIVPQLIKKGWLIQSDVPQFAVKEIPVDVKFQINSTSSNWFYFESNCEIDGQPMSLQETARLMIQNQGYIKTKTGFVRLSDKSQQELSNFADAGAFKVGKKFSKQDILPFLMESEVQANSKEVGDLIQQLEMIKSVDSCQPSKDFKGKLRDYQQYGVNWLYFLCQTQFGGVLADDMGLGKTIQTLAVSTRLNSNSPCLIIGPTNVTYNWKQEIQKFLPSKTVLVYAGSSRHKYKHKLEKYDYIITSYGIIKNDFLIFKNLNFSFLVVDEAQYIKNPDTQISKALKQLSADCRLALTGTPIENQLQDLWNIFDFVMPGYLGKKSDFERQMKNKNLIHLKSRVKPFILRRLKQEVLDSLPDKTEMILKCPLSDTQRTLYQTVLDAAKKGIRNASGNRERLNILTALLKLRQVCTHPGMLAEFKDTHFSSAKFELFQDKTSELMSENHKVVVFTQFTSMLDIMESWIKEMGFYYERIDGSRNAKQRSLAVDRFQNSEQPGVFLVSLKAGGVGINLTTADYVIHMDLWWNPAIEAQATDRVHRMGQKNKVIVYKFISEGTIEEKIQTMQDEKKALLSQIVDIDSLEQEKVNFDEIKTLLLDEA